MPPGGRNHGSAQPRRLATSGSSICCSKPLGFGRCEVGLIQARAPVPGANAAQAGITQATMALVGRQVQLQGKPRPHCGANAGPLRGELGPQCGARASAIAVPQVGWPWPRQEAGAYVQHHGHRSIDVNASVSYSRRLLLGGDALVGLRATAIVNIPDTGTYLATAGRRSSSSLL